MPCINAVSFHQDPFMESICGKIQRSGFDTIEVSRPPFYYGLPTKGTRETFRRWVERSGLNLYGFDCWVDVLPYTAPAETLADFRLAVEFASDLELGMMISHDPWAKDNGERPPSECLQASLELFRQVADLCADAGLSLVFEPHPDTLSMENSWCVDFIDGLERDNVGVLYDCCHYGVGQPETYLDSIRALGSRIRHIHYSDGDRHTYALHLPVGEGCLDLKAVTSAFQEVSFSGTLTCDMYNYPLLEDGARRNLEHIRAVEEELNCTRKLA